MDSKQNISLSETNSISNVEQIVADGYPLNKRSLKAWIYTNNFSQSYVARKLGLEPEEFKRKLAKREKFNSDEIRRLVELMKAEAAFNVLCFPTKRMRKRVWWQVFGKYREKKEKDNE